MIENHLFQAIHSPVGANAGFAAGLLNGGGGFSLERDRIPEQDLFIGYRENGKIRALPFFKNAISEEADTFVRKEDMENPLIPFSQQETVRRFSAATDTFEAGRLSLCLMNRITEIGDLEKGKEPEVKEKILPAVLARYRVDNTDGKHEITAFFAVGDMKGKQFLSQIDGKRCGVISREGYGFEVTVNQGTEASEIADFDMVTCFHRKKPVILMLAFMGGILFRIPAGHKLEADIALGWYKEGTAVCGAHSCRYYYTEFYRNLQEVLTCALSWKEKLWREAMENDTLVRGKITGESRQMLTSQSMKSYYISSMLLQEDGGRIRWVVNEGTFLMMNTFDLLIDHVFFELRFHPWTIRNQLDFFLESYSYRDRYGLSFTHDMGSHHVFTPEGSSSYEIPDLDGCFSFMTQEQLCNWILAAAVYWYQTGDSEWLEKRETTVLDCLLSMQARDGEEKDGIMDLDSNFCENGSEITTYDSLDISLGQARRNSYIAVKCFAAYLALEEMLGKLGRKETAEARHLAECCCMTVMRNYREEERRFPALLDGRGDMAIIPVIEGLIYPYFFGRKDAVAENGEYGELIDKLKIHMDSVLTEKLCMFDDGGWKLSQTSDNSWISKIFLCQFITEKILKVYYDRERSDRAHLDWWTQGCPSCPGIDQIFAGKQSEKGFHYPRCVTSTLWLEE